MHEDMELKNRRANVFQPFFLMEGTETQRLAINLWETLYPEDEEEFEGFHCPGCGRDVRDAKDFCGECSIAKVEYLEGR